MKNRLLITITGINGSRHYNVHKIAKYIFLYGALAIGLIIAIGAGMIWFINDNALELEKKKIALEISNSELEQKTEKLHNQIIGYADVIQEKEELIASVDNKLIELEEMIGVKRADGIKLSRWIDVSKMTTANKLMLLRMVPSGFPLEDGLITGRYGYRTHPLTKKRHFHQGIDLRAKRGTKVFAPADGIVEYSGYHKRSGYGNLVIVSHSFGFRTYYAHLKVSNVKLGDFVKKGDLIAWTGNSGRSSGPHLHYEIRYLQMSLNPRAFLKWDLKNYDYIFKKEKGVRWDEVFSMLEYQNNIVQQ